MSNFMDHVRRKSGMISDSEDELTATSEDIEKPHHLPKAVANSMSRRLSAQQAAAGTPRSVPVKAITTNPAPSATNAKSALHKGHAASNTLPVNQLTEEDIEICQRLDEEFERALEEREIGYNARYASVRQSAVLSVCFMVAFLLLGTAFFMRQAAWTIPEAMLFSIYTITTVGYGRQEMPTTPGFQAYTIFYIMVGIAALTIMVAQVYQCIALEASRAQHARDKTAMARRGLDILSRRRNDGAGGTVGTADGSDEIIDYRHHNLPGVMDSTFRCIDRMRDFFYHNEIGRGISVIFPFAGLILLGAIVVGPIEEWTFLEAIYFSVVSLTTVGFGDYVPTENVTILFSIFWLPFSVGFMSMYLGNVAAFYIRLSDRNIRRIERQMRRRLQRAKDRAELERAEVLRRAYRGQEVEVEAAAASIKEPESDGSSLPSKDLETNGIPISHAQSLARRQKNKARRGFNAIPTSDTDHAEEQEATDTHSLFGSNLSDSEVQRRQRIIENHAMNTGTLADGATMQSMRDVVRRVRSNLNASKKKDGSETGAIRSGPDVKFMSIRSTQRMTTHNVQTRKPSFALRVLVQERFAEIIATEIAGYQSAIEIEDTTLSVTIDSLRETADKWLIPRRARKPFRSVAFEVLCFVGEYGLITRGADALYDLSPFEFHGLFSPLVAAMVSKY